jgi:predicted MFS family arabinose efflux permease
LLYQVGLGFTPVQSGLLIMPQAVASMCMKVFMTRVLTRLGYRGVLISNTLIIGILLLLFATIGLNTSIWIILVLAFLYGGFTSLQYTSMNTLAYADISDQDASHASSIASTAQQMSISFGVAIAGLTTAVFLRAGAYGHRAEFIHGIHKAFVALGAFTILSTMVFSRLRADDGVNVSQHKVLHIG